MRGLVGLLAASLVGVTCGAPTEPISFEERYSEFLTTRSDEFIHLSGENASQTVGVVQLFQGTPSGAPSSSAMASKEMLLETRDRSQIDAIFRAIQTKADTAPDAMRCSLDGTRALTITAFDSLLPRAAMIRLYACSNDPSGLVFAVAPIGNAGMIYSRAIVGLLEHKYLIPKEWLLEHR